ncbi:DUF2163 domain-containing protein [Ensifer sp. PDNC004]|uniref:DUF2163 domain-containing protein n=1 Tax=Ensifer sp. PDNC004 TaxID=2811423 RepID=UPI00196490E7|nr:DUF2163 domain-containing protein [Ensifer sp. PDNC004]QRY66556.1 DUF2163 domain-containing protein [Ensifer sp. PDNC004]
MITNPDLLNALEGGRLAALELVRFDLPGRSVGYHRGGRPYTYNGLVYLPNRWLQSGGMNSSVGTAVGTRTLVFSNIPTSNPEDAMAAIELLEYQNSTVIVSVLAGVPESDEVLGVLVSHIYEIDQIRYEDGPLNGAERSMTMMIDLQPPGRSARGQTLVKRSTAEQQFDNDETDTGLEYVATVGSVPEEWGQISR